MGNKKLIDPLGMLISVNTFKQVSLDIYNNYVLKGKHGYLDAMLVNAAFSIEVGLKYLISYDSGQYSTGHKWIDYWKQLDVKYRNCIIIYLVDRCKNKNYKTGYIEKSISDLSDTFQNLRYSFEESNVQIEPKFIIELMYAISFVTECRDSCKETDKELFEAYTLFQMQKEDYVEIQF